MRLTRATRFVWPATNHFFGINKPNSANNAQPPSFLMPKFQNVFALWTVPTNITEGASNANNLTFGTPKPNSANGVLKLSSTKRQAAVVYAPQVDLIYQTEFASIALHLNTGITKSKPV